MWSIIVAIISIQFDSLFKAEKLPLAEVEEVIKSTGTVEDDEGMIKYDGNFIHQFFLDYSLEKF